MDPVRIVQLVAGRLPRRPHLGQCRDGKGWEYWSLIHRHPDRHGSGDRKEHIYLGALTPLQQLAIKQVIQTAWAQKRPTRRQKLVALRKRYRSIRRAVDVLALRAGYSMHGLRLRKRKKMKTNHAKITKDLAAIMPRGPLRQILTDKMKNRPDEALEIGLHMLVVASEEILKEQAQYVLERMAKTGKFPEKKVRYMFDLLSAQKQYKKLLGERERFRADTAKAVNHDA